MRWLLLPLLVAGCGAPALIAPCARRVTGLPPRTIALALTQRPLELEVTLPMLVSCPAGNPVATSVSTELTDPSGAAEPHETSEPRSSESSGFSTTVRFVPRAAGVHHLEARFEPALGLAQQQVQVVADRAQDVPLARFLPRSPCLDLARVGRFLACLSAEGLELWRDGQATRRPARALTPAGDVLWVHAEGAVTRLEDRGGAALDEQTLSLPFPMERGAASLTQLVVVSGARADEVRLEGGALVRGRSLELTRAKDGASGLLLLSPDEVGYGSGTEVCRVSLARTESTCVKVALAVGGAELGALWARELEGDGFGVVRFTDGVASWTPFPARASGLIDGRGRTPVFRWDGRLVVPRPEDLVLEGWPVSRTYGVGEGLAWLVDAAGEVTVYAR